MKTGPKPSRIASDGRWGRVLHRERYAGLWRRIAMVVICPALLVITSCGVLSEAEPTDWAAETRRALQAEGVEDEILSCLLNLARDDLRRGPLDSLATDELLRHCRSARLVIGGGGGSEVPDSELAMTDAPWTLGDDPALDELWDRCLQGSGAACDELFDRSPVGSDYEDFGVSCGRRPDLLDCAELDAPDPDSVIAGSARPAP